MAQTVKLSDDKLLEAAKVSKAHFSRSLNGQIEYWARLGQFVEESGLFDLNKINLAFQGKIPVEDLSLEDQQVHAHMLWQSLEDIDGSDDSVLRNIQQAGGTVYGIDSEGTIKQSDPL